MGSTGELRRKAELAGDINLFSLCMSSLVARSTRRMLIQMEYGVYGGFVLYYARR